MSSHEQALVVEYLSTVRAVVRRLAAQLPSHVDREELEQSGTLGLIDAARRFDPARGSSFEAYSQVRIRGAVIDALRAQDGVPLSVRRRLRRIEGAEREIEQRRGRPARSEELAHALGLTPERFETLRRLLDEAPLRRAAGLDPADDTANACLARRVAAAPEPLRALRAKRLCDKVRRALAALPERERGVVKALYWKEQSVEDLARDARLGPTRVRVLHDRALLRLRARLRALLD
jgi:RNA polymerase sigma factor for flagellar operon FliA